ncbi:MAG TPA: acyltransferase [Acidiferrobacteraceae bacterium]|nr:acyltransferase [Acidiferrobacteraceae bacterium]
MENDADKQAFDKTHATVTGGGSAYRRYQDVVVGTSSLSKTLYYEWCMWVGALPGALGLLMRKQFWPQMFGSCGKGVTFGAHVVVRHPHRIHIGSNVVISEACVLDARNKGTDRALVLGEELMIANGVILSAKGGTIVIGARSGLGAQTIIQSTHACPVSIGNDVIIGPRCYLVGGGNYHIDRLDMPMWQQGIQADSGVQIDNDVWLGANVTVVGGNSIGHGSVIAAASVVTKNVEPLSVCVGTPARVVKKRGESA